MVLPMYATLLEDAEQLQQTVDLSVGENIPKTQRAPRALGEEAQHQAASTPGRRGLPAGFPPGFENRCSSNRAGNDEEDEDDLLGESDTTSISGAVTLTEIISSASEYRQSPN